MPDSIPPPLSVFNTGSTPLIPAFELEMSGGTVTRLSPIRVQYIPPSGGAPTTRAINTTAPLAGGGDLSVDRTHTVDTAAIVTSGRTISTLFPIVGGGDLSANRTLSVDTAFLVNTGRTISTPFPLAGGGDLSANRTLSVDTAFLVTTARTILAGAGLTGGGNLSADRTISLATPVVVSSGGTGASTLAAFGVLYGSGVSAIQALPAMSAGTLIVGSGVTASPFLLGSGGGGTMLISSQGVVGNVVWVNTAAAATAMQAFSGTFTRDTNLASGTQSITGVGFQPTLVLFFGTNNAENTQTTFQGIQVAGATGRSSLVTPSASDGVAGHFATSTPALFYIETTSNYYTGTVTMTADGFDISWTRTGTPTTTLHANYVALK